MSFVWKLFFHFCRVAYPGWLVGKTRVFICPSHDHMLPKWIWGWYQNQLPQNHSSKSVKLLHSVALNERPLLNEGWLLISSYITNKWRETEHEAKRKEAKTCTCGELGWGMEPCTFGHFSELCFYFSLKYLICPLLLCYICHNDIHTFVSTLSTIHLACVDRYELSCTQFINQIQYWTDTLPLGAMLVSSLHSAFTSWQSVRNTFTSIKGVF